MNAELIQQMIQDKARVADLCVIGCIEAIEDRVPNNEEIALFGRRQLSPRLEDFYWKERLIVRIEYWPTQTMPYRIFSLVNPWQPVPES